MAAHSPKLYQIPGSIRKLCSFHRKLSMHFDPVQALVFFVFLRFPNLPLSIVFLRNAKFSIFFITSTEHCIFCQCHCRGQRTNISKQAITFFVFLFFFIFSPVTVDLKLSFLLYHLSHIMRTSQTASILPDSRTFCIFPACKVCRCSKG